MENPQFAYTGPTPEKGHVGFVNLAVVEDGVRFTVRSEGENPATGAYVVPLKGAADLLCALLEALPDEVTAAQALLNPPKHNYWRAGEPDCPPEIKAGNGELHTLRCKRCGKDSPRDALCRPAKDAAS